MLVSRRGLTGSEGSGLASSFPAGSSGPRRYFRSHGGRVKGRKKPHSGPSRDATAAAFSEVKHNPPKILAKTRKKFGPARAEAQRKAIALSKARRGDV